MHERASFLSAVFYSAKSLISQCLQDTVVRFKGGDIQLLKIDVFDALDVAV